MFVQKLNKFILKSVEFFDCKFNFTEVFIFEENSIYNNNNI